MFWEIKRYSGGMAAHCIHMMCIINGLANCYFNTRLHPHAQSRESVGAVQENSVNMMSGGAQVRALGAPKPSLNPN